MLVESPMDLEQKTPKRHKDKKKCWQKAQWTQDKRPLKTRKTNEIISKRFDGLRIEDKKFQKTKKQKRLLAKGTYDLRQSTQKHFRLRIEDTKIGKTEDKRELIL